MSLEKQPLKYTPTASNIVDVFWYTLPSRMLASIGTPQRFIMCRASKTQHTRIAAQIIGGCTVCGEDLCLDFPLCSGKCKCDEKRETPVPVTVQIVPTP